MDRDEVISRVLDRMTDTMYNELDYYMFEELGYTETDDVYTKDLEYLVEQVIKTIKQWQI